MATDNKMPARPDQSISLEVLAMDTCLSDKKITELALMADQVLRKELLLEELISGDHHKAREDVFGALSKDIETFDTQDKLIDFFGQIDDEEALAAAIQEHAPSVTQIVESGIENDNVGELLGEFGINAKSLNKETMTRMKLQSYYAKKIGGDEGVSRFTQLVSKAKNTMAKKTSKRRLGLSISAGLLWRGEWVLWCQPLSSVP